MIEIYVALRLVWILIRPKDRRLLYVRKADKRVKGWSQSPSLAVLCCTLTGEQERPSVYRAKEGLFEHQEVSRE